MKTIQVKWTGLRPLIMHNGVLADPTNPATIRIKEINSKGSKKLTETDYQEMQRLEWEAGLYWDDEDGPIIPSDNIERCVQLGAQKSRLGKDVQAAVLCSAGHAKLEYKGPRTKEELYSLPGFILKRGVRIQKNRIMRTRPMFPTGWNITFVLEYDDSVISSEKTLIKAMQDAGGLVGLGDWRPKFGRFVVDL